MPVRTFLRVRVAWWFPAYLHAVCWFASATGQRPDMGKVGRMLDRAVTVLRVDRAAVAA